MEVEELTGSCGGHGRVAVRPRKGDPSICHAPDYPLITRQLVRSNETRSGDSPHTSMIPASVRKSMNLGRRRSLQPAVSTCAPPGLAIVGPAERSHDRKEGWFPPDISGTDPGRPSRPGLPLLLLLL